MAEEDIDTEEIVETPEQEATEDTEKPDVEEVIEGDDDEVVVSIGGKSPTQDDEPAPDWVKELRRTAREQKKRIRELEAAQAEKESADQPAELPLKPTLAESDYDEEAHAEKLLAWGLEVQKVEAAKRAEVEQQEASQAAYRSKVESYRSAAVDLKVKDFADAEGTVEELFSVVQQGMLVQGADRPELLVYALGKDLDRAKELSSIKDPVQFAFAAGKLEAELKVTSRKPSTSPEKRVAGTTGAGAGTGDKTLERLRETAAETGDMTPVLEYKRKMRQAS